MLVSDSGSRSTATVGYRFAGVLVDIPRARLLVDGAEIAAGALALKLLHAVCEADGALLKRQTLFDRIWPRQVVSDEALSKLIGRTRELLGAYGAALVTVRGQGVRLDAKVTPLFDLPRPELPPPAAPDAQAETISKAPESNRWLLGAAVAGLAAILAVVAYFSWPTSDALLSPGYALRASDLQASRAQTVELVGAAFKAENNGEVVHARALMHTAHDADPTTPVPALMLSWWEAGAQPELAREWITAARARLRADSPAYLRLMVDYYDARSQGNSVRGPINALLDLRPQAWTLQFARAHDQMGNREFAGALRSLQQIPLDIPDPEQVADVLADRVSLGDAAAAALVTPSITANAVINAYLQGRFAYSRGALVEAIAAFDRCREAAQPQRNYAYALSAAIFAALAAIEADSADAVPRVDTAARLCHEQNCETELLGLRAVLEIRAGHADLAAATLTDAWQRNARNWAKPPLLLVALENGLPVPGDPAQVAQEIPRDAIFGGVADVLLAWRAFAAGDKDQARRLLDLAREHGIAQTYHAEDAALLENRLGGSPINCRVDPPFPNVVRLSACVAMRIHK